MPAWLAAIVQVPAVTPVTVAPFVPLTVQTPVVRELKMTGLPEPPPVALAVVLPFTATVNGLKLIVPMVWLPLATVMFWVTCGAGL